MDPVTATAQAIKAFFEWGQTPAGQQVTLKMLALNDKIASDIAGLISHLHDQVQKQGAPNA